MSRLLAAASALTFLLAAPLLAAEVGTAVRFPPSASRAAIQSAAQAPNDGVIVYDSGESAKVSENWDTVLFQGTSSDPNARFEGQRATPDGWTKWLPAQASRHGNGRFWAKVRFPEAGPGAVRLRAVAPSAQAKIKIFSVEVFHSADLESTPGARIEQETPSVSSLPAGAIDRTAWGAKFPKEAYERDQDKVKITLHHTDTPQTWTIAESAQELRFIQDFHMNGRGWNDIAYHYLIDAAGNVFEGRPDDVLGAHTLGNNPHNIGIAILGTYHPPKNDAVTPLEEQALAALGRYLVAKYDIDPDTLKGHRDYVSTDCPGDIAYAKLGELRRLFAQKPLRPQPGIVSGKNLRMPPRTPAFDGAR